MAPASMADKIIVLDGDDDDGESPQPSCSASTSTCKRQAKNVSQLKAQQPVPTHITQSPFASVKKETHVLQAENQRLFAEVSLHIGAQSGGFNQSVWSVFAFFNDALPSHPFCFLHPPSLWSTAQLSPRTARRS